MNDEATGLSAEDHPNPRTYWFVLRCMAIVAGLVFVGFGLYGVDRELPGCDPALAACAKLAEQHHEALMEILKTSGYLVLAYALLSQGVSAVQAFVTKGRL